MNTDIVCLDVSSIYWLILDTHDLCQSNDCKNGATCQIAARGGYECICPPYYSGPLCEGMESMEWKSVTDFYPVYIFLIVL